MLMSIGGRFLLCWTLLWRSTAGLRIDTGEHIYRVCSLAGYPKLKFKGCELLVQQFHHQSLTILFL